ncbi:MAG TPA: DUF302 domain-containing protein [Motilibacterales bacterium]|nr:DUF302 domain-containing protein [Motilibacterales bacterium]
MTYGLSVTIDRDFDAVLADLTPALAEQGFGIVSEIDMQQTLRTKIGVEIEPHMILGACNPGFAHRSLEIEPSIGLLLPCNIVVRRAGGATVVEAIDPQVLVDLTGNPEMAQLASEVSERLQAVLDGVSASGG